MTEGLNNACGGEYEELLRFERLLTDLSARFIHIAADQVDAGIEDGQRRVCECLGLDLSALWQWMDADLGTLRMTHLYRPLGGPPVPELMPAEEFFPWSQREVRAGRITALSSIEDAPAEAERDKAMWRHFNVKTSLTIPLGTGGDAPFGAISFNDMQRERSWPEPLVARLVLVAQVFANAIARKQADLALRRSEARLELAAHSAGAGLWGLDLSTERYWLTALSRNQFGFTADEVVTLDRVLEKIHPDDRDRVRQTIAAVLASGTEGRVEYRIMGVGGQMRWMASRGRLQFDPAGNQNLLMGITVDITETKTLNESLRASEARLASAVDLAELGFYEVDGKRFTFLDNLGRDLAAIPEGQNRYESVLHFWIEHLHPDDKPAVLALQRMQREGERDKVTVEYRYLHPQRGTIWIHHLSHILERDADGQAVRMIGVMRDVTPLKESEENLRNALEEVRQLRDRLQMENTYLREQLKRDDGQDAIVGESAAVLQMISKARKVAPTGAAVLISGETGTGKELLAQAIHDLSPRKRRAMVKVNCAALPAALIEGELFGREKGAYTGAMTQQHGRFEVADGSTIFLDEIGDLPLELQTKLLRVLQDGRFERLGSTRTLSVDVRVIAATNHDLAAMVRNGTFREDLFHRLNVFPIEVPPLRTRTSDIPMLVWKFIEEFNVKMGRAVDSIPKQSMERLKAYPWPGNVRELRNMVERSMIISEGCSLVMELPESGRNMTAPPATLEEVERSHILSVLERTRWRISGRGGAAEILGLVPTTLHSRMKKLGIVRPNS